MMDQADPAALLPLHMLRLSRCLWDLSNSRRQRPARQSKQIDEQKEHVSDELMHGIT